jgi:hypothetical protein
MYGPDQPQVSFVGNADMTACPISSTKTGILGKYRIGPQPSYTLAVAIAGLATARASSFGGRSAGPVCIGSSE